MMNRPVVEGLPVRLAGLAGSQLALARSPVGLDPLRAPKGSRNKRTCALLEAAEAGGDMPLDFLLRLMRDPHASMVRRLEAAKAAAPFLHARLNSIDQQVTANDPAQTTHIRVSFVPPRPQPDE